MWGISPGESWGRSKEVSILCVCLWWADFEKGGLCLLSASEVLIPCAGSLSVCVAGVFPALHEALKSMGKGLTELPRQVGAQVTLSDIADMLFEKLRNCGIPHLIQLPHSLKKTAVQDMSMSEGEPPPLPHEPSPVCFICAYMELMLQATPCPAGLPATGICLLEKPMRCSSTVGSQVLCSSSAAQGAEQLYCFCI